MHCFPKAFLYTHTFVTSTYLLLQFNGTSCIKIRSNRLTLIVFHRMTFNKTNQHSHQIFPFKDILCISGGVARAPHLSLTPHHRITHEKSMAGSSSSVECTQYAGRGLFYNTKQMVIEIPVFRTASCVNVCSGACICWCCLIFFNYYYFYWMFLLLCVRHIQPRSNNGLFNNYICKCECVWHFLTIVIISRRLLKKMLFPMDAMLIVGVAFTRNCDCYD